MLDSIPSTGWSTPVTLTVDELWQVRRGAIRFVSGTVSGPNDGIVLTVRNEPIRLPAGITVQVREHRSAGWLVLEFIRYGTNVIVSINGNDVTVTGAPTMGATTSANFFATETPIRVAFLEVRDSLPSSSERSAIRTEASAISV